MSLLRGEGVPGYAGHMRWAAERLTYFGHGSPQDPRNNPRFPTRSFQSHLD
jgi:hypothetical protein